MDSPIADCTVPGARRLRAGAAALAGIHSEAAVKALCTALGHTRFEVRIAAVRALAAQGAAGQPPLRAQLAVEEDPLVRDAVHSML